MDATADLCDCGFPLMFLRQEEPSSAALKPSRRPVDDGDTDQMPVVPAEPPPGVRDDTDAHPLPPAPGLVCAVCGEDNPTTRTWCERCGNGLRLPPATTDELPVPPPPRRRRLALVAGVLAAAVVGVGLGVLAAALLRDGGGGGTGADDVLGVTSVSASATAPANEDAAGNPVTYDASNAVDGDPTTAWRVSGDGVGEQLVLTLDEDSVVEEVGLIPGYAKVDPTDGSDRFQQNRTVTQVRWSFDGGVEHVQDITDPGPTMAWSELPDPVTTRTVTLTVTGSGQDFSRDFTAVSEVEVRGR